MDGTASSVFSKARLMASAALQLQDNTPRFPSFYPPFALRHLSQPRDRDPSASDSLESAPSTADSSIPILDEDPGDCEANNSAAGLAGGAALGEGKEQREARALAEALETVASTLRDGSTGLGSGVESMPRGGRGGILQGRQRGSSLGPGPSATLSHRSNKRKESGPYSRVTQPGCHGAGEEATQGRGVDQSSPLRRGRGCPASPLSLETQGPSGTSGNFGATRSPNSLDCRTVPSSEPKAAVVVLPQCGANLGKQVQGLRETVPLVGDSGAVGISPGKAMPQNLPQLGEVDPDVAETEKALREHALALAMAKGRQRRRRVSADGCSRDCPEGYKGSGDMPVRRRMRQGRSELTRLLSWNSSDSELLKQIGAALVPGSGAQEPEHAQN